MNSMARAAKAEIAQHLKMGLGQRGMQAGPAAGLKNSMGVAMMQMTVTSEPMATSM